MSKEKNGQLNEYVNQLVEYLEREIDTPYKGERRCYERVLEIVKQLWKEYEHKNDD